MKDYSEYKDIVIAMQREKIKSLSRKISAMEQEIALLNHKKDCKKE